RTQTADSPSYRLLGASLSWRVNRHLEASLVADNLNNSAYLLDNGFNGGPGTEGPGRNVKLAISARY
ncbi:TonB-dependent receptor, partial [Arthrospira platensis SPKY1]|nr:TonB-dependent receptor [Arthrospira platensis SPKY1]